LFRLTEKLSLDVNYQYVNLGAFKGSTAIYRNGIRSPAIDNVKALNGGEIKTQELMVGLQYKF
jgi:opacity protein-like surface antigen